MEKIPFSADLDSFKNAALDENSADPDPFRQFSRWFNDAMVSGVTEPEAMFLATSVIPIPT